MKAETFTSIVSRLRPRLLNLAWQFQADADVSEDAVQEALMRLWIAWENLPEAADAERLAIRLTKHACIDDYRRRQQQPMVELKDNSASTTDDVVQDAELQQALDKAVAALPPAERRMWTMFTEAQMNSAQISAATGIAMRSVSTMLSAAKRHIVESLKKGGAL